MPCVGEVPLQIITEDLIIGEVMVGRFLHVI